MIKKAAYEMPGMFRIGGFQEVTSGRNLLLLDVPTQTRCPYLIGWPC